MKLPEAFANTEPVVLGWLGLMALFSIMLPIILLRHIARKVRHKRAKRREINLLD